MPKQPSLPPQPVSPVKPHLVAALIYDGLCTFEYGLAVEVFGLPRPEFPDWYRFVTCAVEARPYRAIGGITVQAEHGLEALEEADTIVIPGWRDVAEQPPKELLQALRRAHARGARLMTICSGVFLLAAAGLLEGRRATTHWRYAAQLAARYPEVKVDANVLYVDEGQILTSAGSAAGLDLCLHVVRRDHGPAIANKVARRLVLPAHREGGQVQFIEPPQARGEAVLGELLTWLREHLHEPLRVAELARRSNMSLRTFIRRFQEATGLPPARWIAQARVAHARACLEDSDLSVEEIASRCGYGSADSLRHHFREQLGVSPLQYRRAYRAA